MYQLVGENGDLRILLLGESVAGEPEKDGD
jgi:hypothetical protein